jgi:putative colanic acid biosynthesis acetyltransferase WcaF
MKHPADPDSRHDARVAARFDVSRNRAAPSWTGRERLLRVVWALAQPLFRWSPRPLWGWRRWLLRRFGARVGRGAHVYPTVRISIPWHLDLGDQCAVGDRAILYALGPISIGPRATISQGAHICAGTHDIGDAALPLLKLPIEIGAECWICADAFVGPDVRIGPRAILGARAVAMKDVPAGMIMAGNPARAIRKRD